MVAPKRSRRNTISKSKFTAGRQCLKRQWLQIHRPDLEEETSTDIKEQGTAVGVLARTAFPGGVLVETDNYDFDAAVFETQQLMADPKVLVLFEAAFVYNQLRIRVDVLARMGEGWSIGVIPNKEADYLASEVKASNSVKEHQIEDVSFQVYVLRKNGLQVREVTICHLNRDYIYPGGKIETAKLFKMEPVVAKTTEWVEAELAKQLPIIGQATPPVVETGSHCHSPYPCEFQRYCRGERVENAAITKINRAGLRLLNTLRWPLHFFDFEALSPAIPSFIGTRPWQQILTQWSCHTQYAPGSPFVHSEYLHEEMSDPRRAVAESLIRTLGETGSVIIYSSYERTRLRELAEWYPDL